MKSMLDIKNTLVGTLRENYSEKYQDHLLKQYEIFLQSAEKISDRRQNMNIFFLSINTGLVGLMGYLNLLNKNTIIAFLNLLPINFAGIILCFIWYQILCFYKGLNESKYLIIHEIEKDLPLRPYKAEWVCTGEGKDPKKYKPFTDAEVFMPGVFFLLHLIVLIESIPLGN